MPSTHHAANRRGIACVSAAMVCFVVNDMTMKKLAESLPLAQLIVLRGTVASLLVLAVAHASGATQRMAAIVDRRVLLRSAIDGVGSLVYLAALVHLPLANATAINLASPLVIAVLAVVLMGERARPARWVAVGGGFVGVLLIVQPAADGFTFWAWVCLAGTLCHACRDLLTRRIGDSVPALLITLANAVAVTLAAAIWVAVSSGLEPVSWRQATLVGAASVMLSAGYLLIVLGMRSGEMTVVAPFRYVGLLAALALGWAVWGDLPNAIASGGIVLLLVAGIYLLHEQRSPGR